MKVGLLFPSSNAHPSIGIQFIDGLKKCLAFTGLTENITLISEGIGFGGAEKEVYQKAEKLLLAENTDILVAYIDLKVVAILEPLVFASNKLMIVVNAGANFPQNWVSKPNIIYLTLQHSFLCWLNGFKAAQNDCKNGLLASSFYDCGYLHSAAMIKKFLETGGNITYNYINNLSYDDKFHINELIGFLESNNDTKNLLCVYDSKPAGLFYELLKRFDKANELRLYVSPMMLEKDALKNLPQSFPFSIEGFLPWNSSLNNSANEDLKREFVQQAKQIPNIFTLQGWETALVLQQIMLYAKGNITDGETVTAVLMQYPIDSPRGVLRLDDETNYYKAPFIHYSIEANTTEIKTSFVENFQKDWEAFTATSLEGISSGWTNTYLCY